MLEDYKSQIYECSRCGFCRVWGWQGVEHVCPTYPFSPGWETQFARGRVRMARATLEDEIEVTQELLDHAYACTLCGSCEEHCPVGLPLNEIFHAWRVDLAESGKALPDHERVVAFTKQHLNPYGPKWDDDETASESKKEKVSVLFYPGCTTNRMSEETVEAVGEILQKLGLESAIFDDDTCCGFPLYELGQMEAAKEIAAITLERIKAHDPDVVLTTCPACFKTFKFLLPEEMELETGFDVQHISEFLKPLVEGRLAEMPEKVTWHDPCVLGRHLNMYDEPRELLNSIPELDLVEMPAHREHAQCCGAGGGVYFTCQSMANEAVVARLEQAVETEASQIVTSCPNCYVRFRQMSRSKRIKIKAMSLAQIINEALD